MSVSCLYSRIDLSVACRLAFCMVELICWLADDPLSADSLTTVGLGSSSSKLPIEQHHHLHLIDNVEMTIDNGKLHIDHSWE